MTKLSPLKWFELLLLFGIPTVFNFIACRLFIPLLSATPVFPIEVNYFRSVGGFVLMPMFFAAICLSRREAGSYKLSPLLARMRVKNLSLADTFWTIATFLLLVLASYLIAKIIMPRMGMNAMPFFFQNMPLNEKNMWILYLWPLFFFFNIFGEEFFWRGYIQPRQELLNKKWTWLVHGLLWAFWHLPMGIDLIVASTPIFFILPAVVQIRKNTTIAIIVHFIFGAFGFLSLALGFVH